LDVSERVEAAILQCLQVGDRAEFNSRVSEAFPPHLHAASRAAQWRLELSENDMARWAIIIHGGAGPISPKRREASRAGCLAAVSAGADVLRAGGSALDAAEAAIRVLEDDATFNAGFGSVLNALGEVELDASIMDGSTLAIGAVGAVQGLKNPIHAARLLLPESPVLLAGPAARRWAVEHGAEGVSPEAMIAPHRAKSVSDTVGAVALDAAGHLAAGLSTGGRPGKLPGRIGDVGLPGCGFFADDQVGAAVFSGEGEAIARRTLAAETMRRLEEGEGPQAALATAISRLGRIRGAAGGIALSRSGEFGCVHNTEAFAVGLASDQLAPAAVLDQGAFEALTA
jgi:beta-aspartyl-peptidase (threonine type)